MTAKQAQTALTALSYVCPPGWRLTANSDSVEIDRPGFRTLVLFTPRDIQRAYLVFSHYGPDQAWTLIAVECDRQWDEDLEWMRGMATTYGGGSL